MRYQNAAKMFFDFLTHFDTNERYPNFSGKISGIQLKHECKIMMTDEWKFIYACCFSDGIGLFFSCFFSHERERERERTRSPALLALSDGAS